MAYLFILLTVSSADRKPLILMKSNLFFLFFSRIKLLVLHLESHHKTQGHLDFSYAIF